MLYGRTDTDRIKMKVETESRVEGFATTSQNLVAKALGDKISDLNGQR